MREFDFNLPFVAADGLIYAGKRYTDGELFPWRKLSVSECELWDLWTIGRIDTRPSPVAEPSDAELELLTAPPAPRPPATAKQSTPRR